MTKTDAFRLNARLKARSRGDKTLKQLGRLAMLVAFAALFAITALVVAKAVPAFTHFAIDLETRPLWKNAGGQGSIDAGETRSLNYQSMLQLALEDALKGSSLTIDAGMASAVFSSTAKQALRDTFTPRAGQEIDQATTIRLWLSTQAKRALLSPEMERNPELRPILAALEERGLVYRIFRLSLFTMGDSQNPEASGLYAAAIGSFLTLCVALLVSAPIGIGSAIYLEEFAARRHLTDIIEININNLAAVPSIIFGLLGLALFINVFHLPRSSPLVGGLTLALMMLPTIIISARGALASVPQTLKAGALAIGASPIQAVFHHVVPHAMPGIITGLLIATAQALGSTAPLLLLGFVVFVVDAPAAFTDAATALPVQIFMWAQSPEAAFTSNAAAAILVLLLTLLVLNTSAMALRRTFETRL